MHKYKLGKNKKSNANFKNTFTIFIVNSFYLFFSSSKLLNQWIGDVIKAYKNKLYFTFLIYYLSKHFFLKFSFIF
jgi:hypothetical protein